MTSKKLFLVSDFWKVERSKDKHRIHLCVPYKDLVELSPSDLELIRGCLKYSTWAKITPNMSEALLKKLEAVE